MKIVYNDKDIYKDVKIIECIYETRCDNQLSHLRMVFEDTNHEFDLYEIKQGEIIRVIDGQVDTKKMYINEINPSNIGYEIVAYPIRKERLKEKTKQEWKSIYLKKLANDIAKKHDLVAEYYGVDNRKYKKLQQDNEADISFIAKRAILEGCVLIFFDNKMILASQDYLASQELQEFQIDDYDVSLKKGLDFKECEVIGEKTSAKYSKETGCGALTYNIEISTKAEGKRFAKNLLKYRNKDAYCGCIKIDEVMEMYSSGSVVLLKSENYPTARGKVLFYRIRHDLTNGKSKIWFRKMED